MWLAGGIMVIAGVSWTTMLSGLNVAAQMAVPSWIKASALAVDLLVFQGSITAGSILWGVLASRTDIPTALTRASAALAIATLVALRSRLPAADAVDLTPSGYWAEPVVSGEHAADQGPAMILIECRVDPARTAEFVGVLQGFNLVRRRDGALRKDVVEDAELPGLIVESFVVASWLEHLRQHEWVTQDDRLRQEQVRLFHTGDRPLFVWHLIVPDL